MDKKLDEKEKLLSDMKKIRERINAVLGENGSLQKQKNKRISESGIIDEMLNQKKKSVK